MTREGAHELAYIKLIGCKKVKSSDNPKLKLAAKNESSKAENTKGDLFPVPSTAFSYQRQAFAGESLGQDGDDSTGTGARDIGQPTTEETATDSKINVNATSNEANVEGIKADHGKIPGIAVCFRDMLFQNYFFYYFCWFIFA